jgi:hypothetical protein
MRSRCTKRKSFSALSHAKIAGPGRIYRAAREIFIYNFNGLIRNYEHADLWPQSRYRFRDQAKAPGKRA